MGLDTVELILEMEDAFGIQIPDDDALQIQTVGECYRYVLAKTPVSTDSPVCLAASTFYSVRQAAATLGIGRRLRPSDPIERLLPVADRRQFWAALQSATQLKLPDLQRPETLDWIGVVLTIAVSVLSGVAAYSFLIDSFLIACFAGAATGFIAGSLFNEATKPAAVLPPSDIQSLRALTESALGLNFRKLTERRKHARETDIWIALRSIISRQLGLPPERIHFDASFVNDLGCD